MFRPDRPHTPTDDELAAAAAAAVSESRADPTAVLRGALAVGGAATKIADGWLYGFMVPLVLRQGAATAAEFAIAATAPAVPPPKNSDPRAFIELACDQAVLAFHSIHVIIDSLCEDIRTCVAHGMRAALHAYLANAADPT